MKMSLSNVQKGYKDRPDFILLYGVDGVGKTSFGANAPNPIFLGTEDGSGLITAPRFPIPSNHAEIIEALTVLYKETHDYKTLVIDSLDWWESMLWAHVCASNNWKSIEDAGYGKGYVAAIESWQVVVSKLQKLREKMNIILICHAQVKTFHDPTNNESYDRYMLKLNDKAASLFREAVDNVFFANYETKTTKEKGATKAKAFGGNDRFIYSERRPAYDAKNRYNLPHSFPLSWDEYAAHKLAAIPSGDGSDIDKLIQALDGIEGTNDYLISIGWLKEGQTIKEITTEKASRAMAKIDKFIEAIKSHNLETEQ